MSAEIPFHIQEEIIKRVPVVSLLRFRSVSKAWKSLIDSSDFITAHSVTQQHHLLADYGNPVENAERYVSFVDDDTFPQQRIVHTLPLSVKLLKHSFIVGSSHGLLCLHGYYDTCPNLETEAVVLCNPSIRKWISVSVPSKTSPDQRNKFGFGVCPVTGDPKIVVITQFRESSYHGEASVYNLRLGKWRSLSVNPPCTELRLFLHQVVLGRFIYWCAFDQMTNLIMSFDTTNENFGVVDLPDNLRVKSGRHFCISKLRESLVVLEYNSLWSVVCAVWMMEDGSQKSFTKLFTFKSPYHSSSISTLGFRKSGQPIIKLTTYNGTGFEKSALMVYEPNTKCFFDLEMYGKQTLLMVESYTETLVMLGWSDCSSY